MKKLLFLLLSVFIFTGCYQNDIEDTLKCNVSFIASYPITRSQDSIPFDRVSWTIFQNGVKVTSTDNQIYTEDPEEFGSYKLNLDPGEYSIAVIAHNGLGNCTVSNPNKVTFKSSKVTDTYLSYTDFTIGEKDTTIYLDLHRCVAKVNFEFYGEPTNDTKSLKFYYTGGSSTLDAANSYGIVQSRQTEYRDLVDNQNYSIYTFPYKADSCSLKVVVTSLDESENDLDETTISNIPVKVGYITTVRGNIFDKHSVIIDLLSIDTQWNNGQTIEF